MLNLFQYLLDNFYKHLFAQICASMKAQFPIQPYKSAMQQCSIEFLLPPGTKTKSPL